LTALLATSCFEIFKRIFSVYSQEHLIFMSFRVALWLSFSSYSNKVMMGTDNLFRGVPHQVFYMTAKFNKLCAYIILNL